MTATTKNKSRAKKPRGVARAGERAGEPAAPANDARGANASIAATGQTMGDVHALGVPMKIDGTWVFVDPESFPEDQPIAELRSQLEARRAELGIRATTQQEAKQSATFHAKLAEARNETLADVIAQAAGTAAAGLPLSGPVAIGTVLKRPKHAEVVQDPGAGFRAPRVLDPESVRLAYLDAQIPDGCTVCPAGCPWTNGTTHCLKCDKPLVLVTWDLLENLIGKRGLPALGGVKTDKGQIVTRREAIDYIRERIEGSDQLVFFGEARTGKSITAAAYANGAVRAGAERLRWMSPFSFRENPVDRAIGARTLILDDIGEEAGTAVEETVTAAQRVAPIAEVIAAMARTRGRRFIATTYMTSAKMARIYGGGVASRVYDGAEIIHFVRP